MAEEMTESNKQLVWFDGKIIPRNDAKVDIMTHALHYGTAVFEGLRCYRGKNGSAIFRLDDHSRRLINSAKIMGFDTHFSADQISKACIETIKANHLDECYIRPITFLGLGSMGLCPIDVSIHTAIVVFKWGAYLGKEGLERGIRLKVSSYTRHHPNCMMTKSKLAGNYPNSVIAKMEAKKMGFDEALMLDMHGYVSECTGENVFVVRDGVIYTPPRTTILEGITRDSIIKLAKDQGITVVEETLTRDQLYIADEIFLTGSAAEITPVREIDFRQIGSGRAGDMTKKLQKTFMDIAHGENAKYSRWLTQIK